MNNRGSNAGAFLLGASVGAGLMALLDPGRGAWRRSYLRDKMIRGVHVGQREGRKLLREIRNEIQGGIAEQRARMREGVIPDDQLIERVRAQVGHVVRNFGMLEISSLNGHVTVRGPVLRGEREQIEHRLRDTRGVRGSSLEVSEHDDLSQMTGSMAQPGTATGGARGVRKRAR